MYWTNLKVGAQRGADKAGWGVTKLCFPQVERTAQSVPFTLVFNGLKFHEQMSS